MHIMCDIQVFFFGVNFQTVAMKKSSDKGGKEFLGNKGQSYHIMRKKTLMLPHLDN
jgi:hypothetical protein